jgi:lysophospholipase L1-like esterase
MLSRRSLLAAAPLALAAGSARAVPLAATPISRLDTPWWKARHQAKLAELARGAKPDLVWLGDSITENFERAGPQAYYQFQPIWQRHYARYRALNLGFKGDSTCHLLWRLKHGEIAGIAPRAAAILIGANNFGRVHWGAADTLAGIEAVVAETSSALPNAGILLLSVLPSDRGPWVAENTRALNRDLAAKSWPSRVIYQDVSGIFLRDGQLDRGLFYDPKLSPPEPALHPTPEGMNAIAEAIAPNLARLIGND